MENRTEATTQNVDLDRFMEDIKTVVRDGQELLRAGVTGVKSRAREGMHSTERSVRENPYRSMGLVFGLGVVVGIMAVSMFSSHDED